MIKYLGSKRRLVPVLGRLLEASGARTALDLFTGTTRVAQEFKRRGARVTAVDRARYAATFAQCYIATSAGDVDQARLHQAIDRLNALPGRPGYVTDVLCRQSRFFQPHNGARVDAIRDAIRDRYDGTDLGPILLTSLIEAADRVDSTTGVQMAYVKQWAARSYKSLELRVPELLPGPGRAVHGCATTSAPLLGPFDLAYLDPPYNQHRYEANYHIWETLVAWDAPGHYGVACKREDLRDPATKSVFNVRARMPDALRAVIGSIDARVVVVSYNDESWLSADELRDMCAGRGRVALLAFESARYVGARIGIHNPKGEKVGTVGRLSNVEYLAVAGPPATVDRMAAAASAP